MYIYIYINVYISFFFIRYSIYYVLQVPPVELVLTRLKNPIAFNFDPEVTDAAVDFVLKDWDVFGLMVTSLPGGRDVLSLLICQGQT